MRQLIKGMKYTGLLFVLLMMFSNTVKTVVFGSNTAVSRQSLASFPANDVTNTMLGFGCFENGFTLASSAAIVSYNSFFPIYSTMTFNGGTLNLARNLTLGSTATFSGSGSIGGNGYLLNLPDKATSFSIAGSFAVGNITLVLNSNLTLSSLMTFTGTSVIEGQGHTIDLGSSGKIAVGNGATLLINNVFIKNIAAGQLYCTDSQGTFSFGNATLLLDGNYSFTQGKIDVVGDLNISGGAYTFAYQSSVVSTITSGATLFFDSGMTFSYDVSSTGTLLAMSDNSSILYLYETTLFSNVPGLTLIRGTVVIDGECPVNSTATSQANGITFGDGVSSSNNINLKILPESGLSLNSGYFVNKNL